MLKRSMTLLAVTMLTATSVGCNCCPCLRNICPWSCCGTSAAPAAVPVYATAPACPPAPVYAAAPACPPSPVYAATPQQYTVPQYAMPAQPVYSDAACGTPYAAAAPCTTCAPYAAPYAAAEMGCGMPYTVGDPSCGYMDSGYSMPGEQVMVDPSPAP